MFSTLRKPPAALRAEAKQQIRSPVNQSQYNRSQHNQSQINQSQHNQSQINQSHVSSTIDINDEATIYKAYKLLFNDHEEPTFTQVYMIFAQIKQHQAYLTQIQAIAFHYYLSRVPSEQFNKYPLYDVARFNEIHQAVCTANDWTYYPRKQKIKSISYYPRY